MPEELMHRSEIGRFKEEISPPGTVKPWPINRNALKGLREATMDALDIFIAAKHDADIGGVHVNALTVLYPYWAKDLMWVAYALMLKQAKQENPDLHLEPAAYPRICAYIENGKMPNPRYINILLAGPPTAPMWRKAARSIKSIFNSSGRVRRHLWPFRKMPADAPAILGLSSLAEDHARTENKRLCLIEPEFWFEPIKPSREPKLATLAGQVSDCLLGVLQQESIPIDDCLGKWLRETVETGLRLVVSCHEILVDHPVPQELWIGSASAVWPRTLAYEVLQRGGRVIAHDHGSGAALSPEAGPGSLVSGIADQFVTYSDACAVAIQEAFAAHSFSIPKKTEIFGLSHDKIRDLTTQVTTQKHWPNQPIRHVVFVPVSCTGEYFSLIPHPDDVPAADFNRRVVLALMEEGYLVTVKPHPMTSTDSNERLVAATGCRIETRPFEELEGNFDAVLFTSPFTSIFAYTLKLGVPVALLDIGLAEYTKTWQNLLVTRVGVASTGVDARNNLTFEKQSLIAVLDQAQARNTDTRLVDAFYG